MKGWRRVKTRDKDESKIFPHESLSHHSQHFVNFSLNWLSHLVKRKKCSLAANLLQQTNFY